MPSIFTTRVFKDGFKIPRAVVSDSAPRRGVFPSELSMRAAVEGRDEIIIRERGSMSFVLPATPANIEPTRIDANTYADDDSKWRGRGRGSGRGGNTRPAYPF